MTCSRAAFDQRWLDLVPSLFDDVAIDRDIGLDVAYWNARTRVVSEHGGRWWVNERECRLVHFSGFNPCQPDVASSHAPWLTMDHLGEFARLFSDYAADVRAAGFTGHPPGPSAHDSFDNGVSIPDVIRDIYLDLDDTGRFGNPFSTGPGTFFAWLQSPARLPSGATTIVPNLWAAIHGRRPDVQAAHPDPLRSDAGAFMRWTRKCGTRSTAATFLQQLLAHCNRCGWPSTSVSCHYARRYTVPEQLAGWIRFSTSPSLRARLGVRRHSACGGDLTAECSGGHDVTVATTDASARGAQLSSPGGIR
jgi:hypothetical protein